MDKTPSWTEIKADYLAGVTTREIAKKYNIKAKTIQDKAGHEKWTAQKSSIYKNLHEKTQDRIKKLTELAFSNLENVLQDDDAAYKDKIQAAKAILDVSGYKTQKQEITGKDGAPLATQKIYVTPQMQIEADKIIEDLKSDA